MASNCEFHGNSDMYGIGIRIGFYLQWFGTIVAGWVARPEVFGMRLSMQFFIAATFLALLIQTFSGDGLRALDVYITLLLTYGGYYYFVPVYIWRIWSAFDPARDPTRWPRAGATKAYSKIALTLLVVVSVYQLWFWIKGVHGLDWGTSSECPQYGFMFYPVSLRSPILVAIHILLTALLLFFCVVNLCVLENYLKVPEWIKRKQAEFKKTKLNRDMNLVRRLEILLSAINFVVAAAITTATELTIAWNNVTGVGVDTFSTAGQTIPVIIAGGLLAHLIYANSNPRRYRKLLRRGPSPDNRPPPLAVGMPWGVPGAPRSGRYRDLSTRRVNPMPSAVPYSNGKKEETRLEPVEDGEAEDFTLPPPIAALPLRGSRGSA